MGSSYRPTKQITLSKHLIVSTRLRGIRGRNDLILADDLSLFSTLFLWLRTLAPTNCNQQLIITLISISINNCRRNGEGSGTDREGFPLLHCIGSQIGCHFRPFLCWVPSLFSKKKLRCNSWNKLL